MRIVVIPRSFDALLAVTVAAMVKVEERELDVGYEDGCFRPFATIKRPEVQFVLECDRSDPSP